jgi:arylsulfatase A-like enzyme
MMSTLLLGLNRAAVGVAILIALACDSPTGPPAPTATGKWNVLVLVPDTIRGDHLSVNGYPKPTSPALEALAREGVNFTRAITVAPRTWQSFASILTGVNPPRHGVRFLFDRPIVDGTPILAAALEDAGYETAAFDGGMFLEEMTSGSAFDHYFSKSGVDEDVMRKLQDWISLDREEPFLAFVKTKGGHWPYRGTRWLSPEDSCEGHDHQFNSGNYGIRRIGEQSGFRVEDAEAWRGLVWALDPDERSLHHRVAHYDAAVRETDELIGKLIEQMRATGLLEETIVVVTSDHGESFGEHGYLQHGPRVDEPVMHVPLLIYLPKQHPDFNPGRRVDALVSVIDIMPTILDAAGISIPEGIEGVSLLESIRGDLPAPRWAYGESGRSFSGIDPERHLPGVAGKHRMVRTAEWKLIHIPTAEGSKDWLFDLRADPAEQVDVAEQNPEKVAELRARLTLTLAADRKLTEDQLLSSEQIEALRGLGYMD